MRGGYIASVSLPPQEKSNHCFGNIFEVFVDRAGNTFLIGPWWSGDVRANHGRRQNCQAEQKCRDQEGNADLTKIQRDLHSSCMWGEAKYKIRKAGIAIWCLTIQLIYVNRSNLKYNVFFFFSSSHPCQRILTWDRPWPRRKLTLGRPLYGIAG